PLAAAAPATPAVAAGGLAAVVFEAAVGAGAGLPPGIATGGATIAGAPGATAPAAEPMPGSPATAPPAGGTGASDGKFDAALPAVTGILAEALGASSVSAVPASALAVCVVPAGSASFGPLAPPVALPAPEPE